VINAAVLRSLKQQFITALSERHLASGINAACQASETLTVHAVGDASCPSLALTLKACLSVPGFAGGIQRIFWPETIVRCEAADVEEVDIATHDVPVHRCSEPEIADVITSDGRAVSASDAPVVARKASYVISTAPSARTPANVAAERMIGASLTGVMETALEAVRTDVPSVTLVVKIRLPVTSRAGVYAIFPSVLKYAVSAAGDPAKVRCVAVPPTTTDDVLAATSSPSGTARVTVRLGESTSTKAAGDFGQTRFVFVSSLTVNPVGANSAGASSTGVIRSCAVAVDDSFCVP
jgi:hypothetical protein